MTVPSKSNVIDAPPRDAMQLGRLYSRWLIEGELEQLWTRMAPELRESFASVGGLGAYREKLRQAGNEREVTDERVTHWLGMDVYSRTAQYSPDRPILQQWMIDPAGTVAAFLVEPGTEPAPSEFLSYETRTPLSLPFEGEWFVYWGGRQPVENMHVTTVDQRFANDFLIVEDMHTHSDDPPDSNERFYCFGRPVLAPADGRTVASESGIPDNEPGKVDAARPLGNHVVIDHGNGEFSVLGQLQRGSVQVENGSLVRRGEVIGRCGNSGASSEPHLHFHLQNGPEVGVAAGLPAAFLHYSADGAAVERGEPRRGEFIRAS
ncbi:MAG: M23 family metallopeptidase [Gemmatimonadetes bacterium]|nr:M23 family metallopeptidase [Gemmatimonadota bacterium]